MIERYRDLGGNLIFLSANNFFWQVVENGRRDHARQAVARARAARGGADRRAVPRQRRRRAPGPVRRARSAAAPWLWQGTGLACGSTFGEAVGGYGIEIDHATPDSPPGTIVLAEIPDLFGPGLTAEMTYYETAAGAKVFAAGTLDFGGSALDLADDADAREPLGPAHEAVATPPPADGASSVSGSSRIVRIGRREQPERSRRSRRPAAIQSVSRTPIALPSRPPANAPSGRTP